MSEIKLLPCPFCGGEAKLEGRYREWDGIYYDVVYVYCTLCGCQTSDESIGERKDREQKSIEKWNNRKPVDDVVERLENNSFWTEPTFDIDGYCNDDSVEVVDLDKAIEIIKEELGSGYDKD